MRLNKQKAVEAAIIISLVAIFAVVLLVFGLSQKRAPVVAQEQGKWTCSFVAPVGAPLKKSSALVNEVYKEYNKAAGYLTTAITSAQGALASISENDNVCDFTKCYAERDNSNNISPDFKLGITSGIGIGGLSIPSLIPIDFDLVTARAPLCAKRDCLGDPCSLDVLRRNLAELESLRLSFEKSYTNISDLFSKKTEAITYDLAEKESEIGLNVTKKEAVERSILWAENELNFCALTDRERELVKAGKLGDRKLMRCVDAVQQGLYERPKIWSEKCDKECKSGTEQGLKECVECLQKCEGTSLLAQLNCKMLRPEDGPACLPNGKCCGEHCANGFDEECSACLCDGLSEKQCYELVCGGSVDNYMCCHQGSLEK